MTPEFLLKEQAINWLNEQIDRFDEMDQGYDLSVLTDMVKLLTIESWNVDSIKDMPFTMAYAGENRENMVLIWNGGPVSSLIKKRTRINTDKVPEELISYFKKLKGLVPASLLNINLGQCGPVIRITLIHKSKTRIKAAHRQFFEDMLGKANSTLFSRDIRDNHVGAYDYHFDEVQKQQNLAASIGVKTQGQLFAHIIKFLMNEEFDLVSAGQLSIALIHKPLQ